MGEPVKTPRPYHSPKHEAMRQATRQSVIAAAGRLFSERGYAGSTIEAIAKAAGVAGPAACPGLGQKLSNPRGLLDVRVPEGETPPAARRVRARGAGGAGAANRR